MKIKYFEIYYGNGWGRIYERNLNTTHQNYISHSEDKIILSDNYEDRHGELHRATRTFHTNFKNACAELIGEHKKTIDKLQKEINLLEQSKDEADYFEKLK